MSYITSVYNMISRGRLKRIDYFRKHPGEVQSGVFSHLLKRAANTKWGRDHNYSSVGSVREFREKVALQTYEDLIPFVERLRNGEKDLLWPGEVKWFAKSSGTTGARSKFIPVTRESLEECHFRGGRDVVSLYLNIKRSSALFNGKGLIMGGSHRINNFSNKSLYGDISAILIQNTPVWFNLVRTPSKKIALTEDFEKKLDLIMRLTVRENVTSISGVPSWFLVLIRQILDYTGKTSLREVWPGLEVFFHGGVSFLPYREHFRTLIKADDFCYMETYNASEGFFGIQDDLSSGDMLLMLDNGIFYEFIPAGEAGNPRAAALTIDEVQMGVNYAMVISTNGGLWRYIIGDTVMFTSLSPHKFIITGRTRHFINVFGEEVIVENADRAVESACRNTGAVVNEYTAGPVFSSTESKGSHEWLIEFKKAPPDIELFTIKLDEALKEINSDYEAKRHKDLNLVMPVVRALPEGTFYRWLKEKNKLGGQNKVPRLSNNREYIEDLYKIAGIK